MPNKNLTDNEIIKALECCSGKGDCRSCPYKNRKNCTQDLKLETADLINRQKAEIEKWQGGYMTQKQEIANLEIELKAMRGAANSYKAEIKNYKQVAEHQQSVTMGRGFEIKRLKAEIERLRAVKEHIVTLIHRDCDYTSEEAYNEAFQKALEHLYDNANAKAEAYKECMARVEDRLSRRCSPEFFKVLQNVLQDELNCITEIKNQ